MLSPKEAVQNIAKENFGIYKTEWLDYESGIQDLADGYWDNRSDIEIKRDEEYDVVESDYYKWIEEAFINWFAENYQELGLSQQEKDAYLEHLHRVGYDKSFNTFKSQWL